MNRKEGALAHVAETSGYRPDFAGWLFANWPIYEEFERLALAAIKRGRVRLSAKFLFELIRWNTALSEDGPVKLNNVFSSDAARLFDNMNPRESGCFEFRERRKVSA